MSQPKLISWYNNELQQKLGEIPVPTLMLIEGSNDTGKSVFAQQLTYGALRSGLKVSYITTENMVKSLISQMLSLSFDVRQYFLKGELKIFPLHVENIDWREEIANLFLEVISSYLNNRCAASVVIIDSLTYMITYANEEGVLTFFSSLRNICDKQRKTVILTVHPYAFSQELLIRVRSICDGHLILEIKTVGDKIVRMLFASKLRGVIGGSGSVIVAFEVDPAFGIKVIPYSQARA
ncbi:MAG: ATPase domain-containing protein [Nitrososphaerales archaeon]